MSQTRIPPQTRFLHYIPRTKWIGECEKRRTETVQLDIERHEVVGVDMKLANAGSFQFQFHLS
jgi:hypothetical protein